ncbi:MAG: hypothetical protein HYV46_06890 [candidate division NC10 bacterium]|nr:hypothetical protein [candidate division NC10 bacterium]
MRRIRWRGSSSGGSCGSGSNKGIVEWWILRERIEQGVEETAQGLDFLVSQDLVIQEWTPEDWPRYRLNRKRLEEIEALVRDPDQKWRVA